MFKVGIHNSSWFHLFISYHGADANFAQFHGLNSFVDTSSRLGSRLIQQGLGYNRQTVLASIMHVPVMEIPTK